MSRLVRTAGEILAEVDANSGDESEPGTRLRVEVYDALAASRSLETVPQQAERHGISRAHMYRIRAGHRVAGLGLAMKIAEDLGTTVETLFERVTDR